MCQKILPHFDSYGGICRKTQYIENMLFEMCIYCSIEKAFRQYVVLQKYGREWVEKARYQHIL